MRIPILASAATFLATAAASPQQKPDVSLSQTWLGNVSSWQQHLTQPEGQAIDKSTRGVWAIGDGHVFTYVGLGRRANTMQALTGPHYQTEAVNAPKGHWGELSLDLVESGKVVALPSQNIWRTRGVNCVITTDAGVDRDVSLTTVNWATTGHDTIYRWIEIRGASGQKVTLRATWERGKANGDTLTAMYGAKGFEASLDASVPATANGNTLSVVVTLTSNAPTKLVLRLRTRRKGTSYRAPAAGEKTAILALDACAATWQAHLANTATIDSDDVKLTDLLEDWKVLMLVQRSEPSGAVSPMVNDRGAWVRDNTGPLLTFLRYGMFDAARRILDYVHDTTLVTGRLSNHVPLDLDVSKAAELAKKADWSKIKIPNGELPMWIILQHEWYYRATNDLNYLANHWAFLRACFHAISLDKNHTLPSEGDETFLHGSFFSLFPDRLPEPAMLPADRPDRRTRSFATTGMYVVVTSAMGEMGSDVDSIIAGQMGRDQAWVQQRKAAFDEFHINSLLKLEEAFWMPELKRFAPFLSPVSGEKHTAPFGPVSLFTQWVGLTYFTGERNKENLGGTLKSLWHKGGARIGMTPTVGACVGYLPGILLYILADLDDQSRGKALDQLIAMSGPAGEWAELYDKDDRPIGGYNQEWPNRCRPLESGINIDAIFFALNGVRYLTVPGWSQKDQRIKLRLPRNARWLRMEGMQHDGHTFDIHLDEAWVKDLESEKSGRPVKKMRFHVAYNRINKRFAPTYVDTAINIGETVYVRYPTRHDPVQETEVWPEDKGTWMPTDTASGDYTPQAPLAQAAKTLVFGAKASAGKISDATVVDIGLPMTAAQVKDLLMDGDKPRYERVVFDIDARATNRATMKPEAFWKDVDQALSAYNRAGGKVLEPYFLHAYSVVGPVEADNVGFLQRPMPGDKAENFAAHLKGKRVSANNGRLDLAAALDGNSGRYVVYAAAVLNSDEARECVLKLGSDDGVAVWVNGKRVLLRMRKRTLTIDADEQLVQLKKGHNQLLFKVYNDGGACGLAARFTDKAGLPIDGLRVVDK